MNDDGSVTVSLNPHHYGLLQKVHDWCFESFPKETWNMKVWWKYQIYTFQNPADADAFMAKWGGKITEKR